MSVTWDLIGYNCRVSKKAPSTSFFHIWHFPVISSFNIYTWYKSERLIGRNCHRMSKWIDIGQFKSSPVRFGWRYWTNMGTWHSSSNSDWVSCFTVTTVGLHPNYWSGPNGKAFMCSLSKFRGRTLLGSPRTVTLLYTMLMEADIGEFPIFFNDV